MQWVKRFVFAVYVVLLLAWASAVQAAEVKFFPAPEGTGETMFSALATAPDGRLFMATCISNGTSAHLLVYDPKDDSFKDLANMADITGENDPQLIPQAKIHTQLVFDKRGVLWFGTHSEHRDWTPTGMLESFPKGYRGGHIINCDPKSYMFFDFGIPIPQLAEYPKSNKEYGESLISLAIDPEASKLYFVTHPNCYLLVYDILTAQSKVVGRVSQWPPQNASHAAPRDLEVAADGNVYLFSYEGQLIKYDAKEEKLYWLDLWIPGSDTIKQNMPYQLDVDSARTHIYGAANECLFELVVEPGKTPAINKLAGTEVLPSHHQHALTLSTDGTKIYYCPVREGRNILAMYDLKTQEWKDLGALDVAGGGKGTAAWAATAGMDGAIYIGGIASLPSGSKLGIMKYIP